MNQLPDPSLTQKEMIPLLVADVFHLAGLFRRWGEHIAAGTSQSQWQVLSVASVGNQTVSQIAHRLGVSRQGVQRTADSLVKECLARYAKNPVKTRSPYLKLTKRGKILLHTLTAFAEIYHKRIAFVARREELYTTLMVVRMMIEKLEEERVHGFRLPIPQPSHAPRPSHRA